MSKETKELNWHSFRQNNSGGSFKNPAISIYVQATSEEEADEIAKEYGAYFDGCSTGSDCSCCGDRWYRSYGPEEDDFDIEEIRSNESYYFAVRDKIPTSLIVFANGKTETVT